MKKSIPIHRTAHYYLQFPSDEIHSIIYVIHGYAQLADDFLQNFEQLKSSSSLIVAPEAISKFYNRDGKMVASWMTSQHRDDEMKDYIAYLNELHQSICQEFGTHPITVLGFSQGVSTSMRWIVNSQMPIDQIHLCAGTTPPELTREADLRQDSASYHFYHGSRDKLFSQDYATKQLAYLKELGIKPTVHTFDGRHEIPEVCLNELKRFSENVL